MMLALYFEQVKNDPPDIISDCLIGSPYGTSCGICSKSDKKSKILPCMHVFCEPCLINYIPSESLTISCPVCRQPSIIPENGIYGLHSDSHHSSSVTKYELFSSNISCNNQLDAQLKNIDFKDILNVNYNICKKTDNLNSIAEIDDLIPIPDHKCAHHNGQDLQFYCRDCAILICIICSNVEHSEHSTTLLQDAVKVHKITLLNSTYKAKRQITVLEKAIQSINEVSYQFSNTRLEIESQINNACNTVIKLVNDRKAKLLSQLEDIHYLKQQHLQQQKEFLEVAWSNIDNHCKFTENLLNNGNEAEVFLINEHLSKRLADYNNLEVHKIPEEKEYLLFKENDLSSVSEQCKNWGQISVQSIAQYEVSVSGDGLKRCFTNQPTSVVFIAKDELGRPAKIGRQLIKAEVLSNGGSVYPVDITENCNGTYKLTYNVPKKCHYKFNVLFNGQHIQDSPFKLNVCSGEESNSSSDHRSSSRIPRLIAGWQNQSKDVAQSKNSGDSNSIIDDDLVLRIGERGCNQGEFSNPQGIACCKKGLILIADSKNQCVQIFYKDGKFKLQFGTRGINPGQIQRPTGIAVMPNGNYVVADYNNKCVNIFDTKCKYLKRIGVGKLLGPKGVTVDRNGRIIVVDNKASSILIFQMNGRLVKKFGGRGNGVHHLAGPHFVTINENNDILISDFHNHKIKVFNSEGVFQFSFGSSGEGNGQFKCPTGLAVDKSGNILVADWGNNRIQVFDHTGSFQSYVNTTVDPLYGPQGLAISEDNHVIVADSGNYCFKVYKYLQ